jgi:Fe2+ or Zn2+ uptake regulation protein
VDRQAAVKLLRERGIQPSAQRVAVGAYVLDTLDHPSADQVFAHVRRGFPMLSRATVYNTLNLFVANGLLRALVVAEGKILFDPNMEPHHHFIDESSGAIVDVPWGALEVRQTGTLPFDVRDVQLVLRGVLHSRTRD